MSEEEVKALVEMKDMLKVENAKLKQEKENLTTIVANKIIEDFDIETPLKDELNNARLEIISLEEALLLERQEKQELVKWLEEEINTLDTIYENLTDAGAVKRQPLKEILERLI